MGVGRFRRCLQQCVVCNSWVRKRGASRHDATRGAMLGNLTRERSTLDACAQQAARPRVLVLSLSSRVERAARWPMPVRIGLTKLATATRPDSVAICEPTWVAIATVAANKLKLPHRQIKRLVLKSCVGEHTVGTALPRGDCSEFLCNDVLIYVSQSEETEAGSSHSAAPMVDMAALPPLPKWPDHTPAAPLSAAASAALPTSSAATVALSLIHI